MKEKVIFALGFFDGVHLGHQALLRRCVQVARELDCEPAAITFDRHPRSLFLNTPPMLISTLPDRLTLLKRFGAQYIETIPVSAGTMSTPWQDFLAFLVEKGAAGFVCGEDFRFGHQGRGNSEKLRSFCEEHGLALSLIHI